MEGTWRVIDDLLKSARGSYRNLIVVSVAAVVLGLTHIQEKPLQNEAFYLGYFYEAAEDRELRRHVSEYLEDRLEEHSLTFYAGNDIKPRVIFDLDHWKIEEGVKFIRTLDIEPHDRTISRALRSTFGDKDFTNATLSEIRTALASTVITVPEFNDPNDLYDLSQCLVRAAKLEPDENPVIAIRLKDHLDLTYPLGYPSFVSASIYVGGFYKDDFCFETGERDVSTVREVVAATIEPERRSSSFLDGMLDRVDHWHGDRENPWNWIRDMTLEEATTLFESRVDGDQWSPWLNIGIPRSKLGLLFVLAIFALATVLLTHLRQIAAISSVVTISQMPGFLAVYFVWPAYMIAIIAILGVPLAGLFLWGFDVARSYFDSQGTSTVVTSLGLAAYVALAWRIEKELIPLRRRIFVDSKIHTVEGKECEQIDE